jgi:hypothetical protein
MGFYLWPLMVSLFLCSLIGIERYHAMQSAPAPITTQAIQAGQVFVAYRNAVMAYQEQNPGFIGSAPAGSLSGQFSPEFLLAAGNAITATGTNGRIVTCYAALPAGALGAVLEITDRDASFGIVSNGTWTRSSLGAAAMPLPVSVPDGDVISVYQVGR